MKALRFGTASSDRITVGNPESAPTVLSHVALVRPTDVVTTNRRISGKGGATGYTNFALPSGLGGTRMLISLDYATTDGAADTVDNTIFVNLWQWVAFTFDGVNAPKLFHALLGQPFTECAYSATTTPAGARGTEANSSFFVGNQSSNTLSFIGSMAFFGWYASALTLQQLQWVQETMGPLGPMRCLFRIGRHGATSIVDESGRGNHGVVTGAVVANDDAVGAAERLRLARRRRIDVVPHILGGEPNVFTSKIFRPRIFRSAS